MTHLGRGIAVRSGLSALPQQGRSDMHIVYVLSVKTVERVPTTGIPTVLNILNQQPQSYVVVLKARFYLRK